MNDAQIIDTLSRPLPFHLTRTYRVWVGDHGYDTRPWASMPNGDEDRPPVAFVVEHASGHLSPYNATSPVGDVLGWLDTLPEGTEVCVPNYPGWRQIGTYMWKIQDGQPVPLGYDCFRMQATISPTGVYTFWDVEDVEDNEWVEV